MDTTAEGWSKHFERVAQSGQLTGNAELQDFVPDNAVEQSDGGGCALQLRRLGDGRYLSAKLRSRWTLPQLAPEGGILEVEVEGPASRSGDLVPGLWPAVWLLADGTWPQGGELDLFEQMHRTGRPDTAREAFSTLHFGPRRGVDAVWQGAWGLEVGRYAWRPGCAHTLRFAWHRDPSVPGSPTPWRLSLQVDGTEAWSLTTSRADVLRDFEKAKHFHAADARDFSPGAPGDPARIFQRAFDAPEAGLRLICNLSFGGTPFAGRVDNSLREADMLLRRVRIVPWTATASTAIVAPSKISPHPSEESTGGAGDETSGGATFHINLGAGWSSLRLGDAQPRELDPKVATCGVPLVFSAGRSEVRVELRAASGRVLSFSALRSKDALLGVAPAIQDIYVWQGRHLQVPVAP